MGWTVVHPIIICFALLSRFDFDGSAGLFNLLLKLFCFGLFDTFFENAWGVFNKLLGFGKTETGNSANNLNDVDLLVASGGKNNIKVGWFFSSGFTTTAPVTGTGAAAAADTPSSSSRALESANSMTVRAWFQQRFSLSLGSAESNDVSWYRTDSRVLLVMF